MNAEILSTGDELRSGTVVDTNTAFIAHHLEQAGVGVTRHGCVGDDRTELKNVLLEIAGRSNLAVVTGGLGPTDDDITALAAADAAGCQLVENDAALEMVAAYFTVRNRKINAFGQKMALLPEGARVMANPAGAAPGFVLNIHQCRFYFLPGVPMEMEAMMIQEVLPHIRAAGGAWETPVTAKTISVFGIPESEANRRLAGFDDRFSMCRLGYRVMFPELHLKIYPDRKDPLQAAGQMDTAAGWIADIMGDHILSPEGDGMAAVLGKLLLDKGATLAVAESCTGGLIASQLTDVAGSSGYFLLSAVTYANDAKVNVLGVVRDTIDTKGAVSEETACQMAKGARAVAGATYGIATTGIAGPDGGTKEKPVGTVCIGIATPEWARGLRFRFLFENRSRNKQVFAAKAMDLLRRELLGLEIS